jgi:hypothetical protein
VRNELKANGTNQIENSKPETFFKHVLCMKAFIQGRAEPLEPT